MAMSFGSPVLFSIGSVLLLLLRYPVTGISQKTTENCSIAINNQNGTLIPIPWKSLKVKVNKGTINMMRPIKVLGAPRKFQIRKDETNLLLTWLHPKRHIGLIKFFYLEVRFGLSKVSHSREYFRLNVTGINIQDKSFEFRCIHSSEKFKDVTATIWSLPNWTGKSESLIKLSERARKKSAERFISLDEDAQESRHREIQCCKEQVEVRLRIDSNQSVQVIVNLHTLPDDSEVEVCLMNVSTEETGKNNKVATWKVNGNGREKNESLNSGVLSPGKYKAKVFKRCRKTRFTIDATDCGPDIVESNSVAVAYTTNGLPEAVRQNTAKQNIVNSSRDDYMSAFLLSSGLTTSILVGVFGVIFVITVCIANFFTTKGSKRHCNPEQGNGEENVALGEDCVEEETVAIIYMRDSSEYDKAVNMFEKMLNDLEVKAQTIRFDSTKLINIIDFSETICRSFKRFIIIISPDLYQLCHYFKHGDNTMYERILTKHCGQCLPVVFLNYLNQICFYGRENVTVYLVQFFEYGQLRYDYMNMFVSDHLVLSTRFRYCLYKLDDHEELQLEEDTLMALVRHLHSTSMLAIANGRNMDIRLKTDVECELKSCAQAIMAMLKNDIQDSNLQEER